MASGQRSAVVSVETWAKTLGWVRALGSRRSSQRGAAPEWVIATLRPVGTWPSEPLSKLMIWPVAITPAAASQATIFMARRTNYVVAHRRGGLASARSVRHIGSRRRVMPSWVLFVSLVPLFSQSPSSEPKAEERSALEGQVVNAASGEPVKKATILLRRADPPQPNTIPASYSTSTEAAGKFSMKDIEAGRYRLTVNRGGFVMAEYGSKGPGRPGTTLSLEKGQHLKEIAVKLTPRAVITGRVLDEDGEPVTFAQVQTLRYRYNQGRKQLMPMGGTGTNDLGEYRIFGLAPGKYYLSATYREGMFAGPSLDRSANMPADADYAPTY